MSQIPDSQLNFIICLEYCSSVLSNDVSSRFSVSIIRDPVKLFIETVGDTAINVKPFIRAGNDVNVFLNNPLLFYTESDSNDYYAKNLLTYKFGFDHQRNDDGYINSAIQQIQQNFDFILIA